MVIFVEHKDLSSEVRWIFGEGNSIFQSLRE